METEKLGQGSWSLICAMSTKILYLIHGHVKRSIDGKTLGKVRLPQLRASFWGN